MLTKNVSTLTWQPRRFRLSYVAFGVFVAFALFGVFVVFVVCVAIGLPALLGAMAAVDGMTAG